MMMMKPPRVHARAHTHTEFSYGFMWDDTIISSQCHYASQ